MICPQEVHGKDEFLQAIQVLVPQFRLFGTFIPNNLSAGGSIICIHESLLPDGGIVTHMITCQGRDHMVTLHSGGSVLVVVNVHFEQWPCYPGALGVITGDFNNCEPEEGRFNVWNQTFIDGDAVKTALFGSFFAHVLEFAQSDFTRKDSTDGGTIRTLSRIDRAFINLSMAEARDITAILMSLRTLVNVPSRVTTQQCVSSYRSRQIGATRSNVSRVGCLNFETDQ